MTKVERRPGLSKSKFIAGIQCRKRLYLLCYERQLMSPPDEATQRAFDRGHEVGSLAHKVFPGGVLVAEAYWDYDRAVERTRSLMADCSIPAVFEGAFTYDNTVVRVDVLQRMAGDAWRLVEVKSSSCVKDVHIPDVAIQRHVLRGCGVKVTQCCLMHRNPRCGAESGEYDIAQCFVIEDITEHMAAFEAELSRELAAQQKTLEMTTPPRIACGPHCNSPYTCEFHAHCNGGTETGRG